MIAMGAFKARVPNCVLDRLRAFDLGVVDVAPSVPESSRRYSPLNEATKGDGERRAALQHQPTNSSRHTRVGAMAARCGCRSTSATNHSTELRNSSAMSV